MHDPDTNWLDYEVLLQHQAAQLTRTVWSGLRAFAKEEGVDARSAALRAVKLAIFHRASEVFLGRRIMPSDVVQSILLATRTDKTVCQWLVDTGPKRSGAEWAAYAIGQLFTPAERRSRGQFFTPSPIAEFMTAWAIQSPRARVLDPGTGPGIFLANAYKRISKLGVLDLRTQLHGVELSPLAPTYAAVALAPSPSRPKIFSGDFLTDFHPKWRYDAIIGNPPYSRHQTLGSHYKHLISRSSTDLVGEHVSMRAGIHVHFLLRSISLLRKNGRLAFLMPREILDVNYGSTVRRFLIRKTRLRGLIVFDPRNGSVFDETLKATSVILLLERGVPDGIPVRVVHVQGPPNMHELERVIEASRPTRRLSWGWSSDVPLANIAELPRWSAGLPAKSKIADDHDDIPLGEFVQIKRGIATGANRFFVLSDTEAKEAGLPRKYLRPVIARARIATSSRITRVDFARWRRQGERTWLLDIRGIPRGAVRKYLQRGMEAGIQRRYLCRNRKLWYQMERRTIPPVLVTYMSKGAPRFIRNTAGVLPLNVFHGLYPKHITHHELQRLVSYLNGPRGQQKLKRIARVYGSGLLKVEPGDLLAMRVPDVRANRRR